MFDHLWNGKKESRTDEVERRVKEFSAAADELCKAKNRLDEALSQYHNDDQFRQFAEGAKKLQL